MAFTTMLFEIDLNNIYANESKNAFVRFNDAKPNRQKHRFDFVQFFFSFDNSHNREVIHVSL